MNNVLKIKAKVNYGKRSIFFYYLLSEINFELLYYYVLPLLNNWLLIIDINITPITHKTTIINEGTEDSIIFSSDAYSYTCIAKVLKLNGLKMRVADNSFIISIKMDRGYVRKEYYQCKRVNL